MRIEAGGSRREIGGSHSSQFSFLHLPSSILNPQFSPNPTEHGARTTDAPTVTWCLSDGRTGHRRQIEGLVRHLGERRLLRVHWIPVDGLRHRDFVRWWMQGRFPPGRELPSPQLIVGAGHVTHFAALAAQRTCGGRTVILMRPTLPTGLFDLCLVPEHDLKAPLIPFRASRVVPTRGVLNPFAPSASADPSRGLVLIGGPSRHHGWSDEELLDQLHQLIRPDPTGLAWTVTTSRRTPGWMRDRLAALVPPEPGRPEIHLVPFEKTGPDWLSEQFAHSGTVFVTEDSVSMVYEALTVGADVGLLRVPRRLRTCRTTRCIDRLVAERLAIPFEQWKQTRFERRERTTFNEAARCADIVCERLLDAA